MTWVIRDWAELKCGDHWLAPSSEVMVIWLTLLPVIVTVPAKVNIVPWANFKVPPVVVSVKLLKVVAPDIVLMPVLLNVTVPLLWVNVPLLVQLPAMLKLDEDGAEKVSPLRIVRLPVRLIGVLLAKALTSALPPPFRLKFLLTVKVLVPKRYSGLPEAGEKSKL